LEVLYATAVSFWGSGGYELSFIWTLPDCTVEGPFTGAACLAFGAPTIASAAATDARTPLEMPPA
jgi:hypothetical protein